MPLAPDRTTALRRMRLLGLVFAAFLSGIAYIAFHEHQKALAGAAQLAATGDLRLMAQRLDTLPADSPAALQQRYAALADVLEKGGRLGTLDVPPLAPEHLPQLQRLRQDDAPLAAASALDVELRESLTRFGPMQVMVALFSLAASVSLMLIAAIFVADVSRQADAARQRQQALEASNRETQDALLALMDELEKLARGDLTARASVDERITGAVADSVNYAIGELRQLVAQANAATHRIAQAHANGHNDDVAAPLRSLQEALARFRLEE